MTYAFYVYYRVAAETAEALERRVSAAQTALALATGIRGRLLHRSGEPLLWMEIYEGVGDRATFVQALDQVLTAHRVTELLPTASRKSEVFEDFPTSS